MSGTCKLILQDEVNCKFEGLAPNIRQEMIRKVSYTLPYARYTPAGRMGRWDGKVNFMNIGGSTYYHMLDQLLPILEKHDVMIEIEDQRIQHNFEFEPIDENIFDYVEFPPGHHMEGKKIVLREHQVNAVNTCLQNPHGLLLASTSSGKAQPLTEMVLTDSGWKKMGDLTLHDKVKCPDGSTVDILGIYPQGIKKTVRVTFEDGRSVECCDEHLWDVYSIDFSHNDKSKRWKTLETKDIIHHLKNNKRPIYIPTISGDVSNGDVELPLDPYLLGFLLGDGYMNKGMIHFSTSDSFIVEKLQSLLPTGYEIDYIENYDYKIKMNPELFEKYIHLPNSERINPLRKSLEELEIYGKLSKDKFIPEIYKNASKMQKLKLIQGLIDSDGHVAKNKNSVVFYNTSEKLIDDLHEILNSIGAVCKKTTKNTKYDYKDGRNECKSFVLTINYNNKMDLCSLPCKKDLLFDIENKISNKLKITKIEYIDDTECQCIYIDHPNHLYITNNYIVTHNTLITAALSKSVEKYGRSIVIVPNKDLVQQTYNDYAMVGLDAGVFYGEKKELNHQHTITTWQSLNSLWKKTKKGEIDLTEQDVHDFINGVIAVIVDEAHTSAAEALHAVLGQVMKNIPLRWGLTGTIPKDPVLAAKIKCNVGEVIYTITAKELQDKKILSTCNVNCIRLKSSLKFANYQEELKYLVTDRDRMKYVATLIAAIAESGNTLVLVDRLEAGELLCEYLGIPKSEFVRGDTKKKDREASYGEIRWADNKILIATYGVASTGISISRLYNVVLIEPGKSFVRTIQSIGRGLRRAEDKDHVEIYDISGSNKYSAKHMRERIAYYNEVQYPYVEMIVDDWQNME